MKKKKIIWSDDAADDLCDIISYIRHASGKKIASDISARILGHVEKIVIFPESGRLIPELSSMGITDIREIIEAPWRICYRIVDDEIRVLSVIDGRRNVEELLYKKLIQGGLGHPL